jgi:hypothetical protein
MIVLGVSAGLKTRSPGLKSGAFTDGRAREAGAKALFFSLFAARLKPCPDTKQSFLQP